MLQQRRLSDIVAEAERLERADEERRSSRRLVAEVQAGYDNLKESWGRRVIRKTGELVRKITPAKGRGHLMEWLGGPALTGILSAGDEAGFRVLGGSAGTRDLYPMSHISMMRVCRYLYESDDLAGFIVDIPLDLALGGSEMSYKVTVDERVEPDKKKMKDVVRKIRDTMDLFWDDPVHDFRGRAIEYMTTLLVDGSLCLQVVDCNPYSGLPHLDFVDSMQVYAVRKAPESAMSPGEVDLVRANGTDAEPYLVVRPDAGTRLYSADFSNPALRSPDEAATDARDLKGQVMYWRYSRIPNSLRGRSYLMRPADWIDAVNQFGWTAIDRARLLNSLLWDVTLKGAPAAECKRRLQEIMQNPPTVPNTVQVHNDAEVWEAKTADLKASETEVMLRATRGRVLGGRGIPEAWFAEGGHSTRATLSEQSPVAIMALKALQQLCKRMCCVPLNYAYDCVQAKMGLPLRVAEPAKGGYTQVTLEPELPPLEAPAKESIGADLKALSDAMVAMTSEALLSQETARSIVSMVVSQKTSIQIDSDDERERIDEEADQRDQDKAEEQAELAQRLYLQSMSKAGPAAPGTPAKPAPPQEGGNGKAQAVQPQGQGAETPVANAG